MSRPVISIIVPVFNEAVLIGPFLEHVRTVASDAEVIVVDGGSEDGTPELCAGLVDQIIMTECGRARQMNAGANIAQGDVFWFLHVDSIIPPNAPDEINKLVREESNAGGCFRLRFPGHEWIYRVSDSLGNLGVQIFGFALGDHGIFCRKAFFHQVGGFPEIPLMEDAEFYRALRRHGRMRQSRLEIVGNQRRYEQLGPYRTTFFYAVILILYVVRSPMRILVAVYERLLHGRATQNHSRPATLPQTSRPRKAPN